jgi:hypothetical protein
MLLNLGSDVCAFNYSTVSAQNTFSDIAADSNTTIFYPHQALNPILAPMTLIIAGGTAVYLVILVVIFRPRK